MTKLNKSAVLAAGAVAAAALLAGCQKGLSTIEPSKPAVDTTAIAQTLKDGEAQWVRDYKARDLAKVEAHYAPDATVMQPGLPVMSTGAALHDALAALVSDPNLATEFSADKVEVAESGDLAYTRGAFTQTTTDPKTKKATTLTGSYLSVYRKQPDGTWKVIEDVAAPTLSPAKASTPATPG